MVKFTEVIGFGIKMIGRFHSRYPETARLYYKPPSSSDSQNSDDGSLPYNKVLLRFYSLRGPADSVEMLQVAS
ncbi:hypothetical protein SUGI_0808640 [Cryptomeria japonica]|nr:hypothetical protein SUGI_0808640 [Cryptomeria japonica]